jgi:pyruvate-formate lyase-activating enzyme
LLKKSAALISRYNIEHEFRTLILPNNHLTENDIDAMAALVDDAPWVFRAFVADNCLNEAWNEYSNSSFDQFHPIIQRAKSFGKKVVIH